MNRRRRAEGDEVTRIRICGRAVVLEIDFQPRDIIVLFVRRRRKGELLAQRHVPRQGALELHAPLPWQKGKFLEHRRGRLLDQSADRQTLERVELHRLSVLAAMFWQDRFRDAPAAIGQEQLEIGVAQRRRRLDKRRRGLESSR